MFRSRGGGRGRESGIRVGDGRWPVGRCCTEDGTAPIKPGSAFGTIPNIYIRFRLIVPNLYMLCPVVRYNFRNEAALDRFAPTPSRLIYAPKCILRIVTRATGYNVAAASMAPAPLNAAGLVTTISTGYFHSMNFAQPVVTVSHILSQPKRPLVRIPSRLREPTPIGAFPPKVLPHIRHHQHGQQQLQLLQRLPPLPLCIRNVFLVIDRRARGGGGQRIDFVDIGGARRRFDEAGAVGHGHGGESHLNQ